MTADFIHFLFCLSLWQLLFIPHGECRTNSLDTSLQFNKSDGSKLTKSPAVVDVSQAANNSLDEGYVNSQSAKAAVAAATLNDNGNSVNSKIAPAPAIDNASKASTSTTVSSNDLKQASPLKLKTKKVQDVETPPQEDSSGKARRILSASHSTDEGQTTNGAPTTRGDRPSTSRGRLKFQSDNAAHAADYASKLPLNISLASDTAPAPVPAAPISTSEAATAALSSTGSDRNSTTRSGKSSFRQRVGSDGYVFERTVDLDADADRDKDSEDFQFEPHDSTQVAAEAENNIDRIRNFNDNSGNVKLGNIVKRPQGFSLTTESQTEAADVPKRTSSTSRVGAVVNANAIGLKKKIGAVHDADPSRGQSFSSSTEINPTSISKNEIVRKPAVKPSFNSRRRPTSTTVTGGGGVGGGTGLSENSLPTTSAVWALAALKTPNSVKIQKRPSGVETIRKSNAEVGLVPKPTVPPTTIKPFVSWSTRLQKTTTEEPMDSTTILRTLLEEDAETISPFALNGPKLMNTSDIREPIVVAPVPVDANNLEFIDLNMENNMSNKSLDLTNVNVNSNKTFEKIGTSTTIPTHAITSTTTQPSFVTEDDIRIDLVDDTDNFNRSSDTLLDKPSQNSHGFNQFNYTIYEAEEEAVNDTLPRNDGGVSGGGSVAGAKEEIKNNVMNDGPPMHDINSKDPFETFHKIGDSVPEVRHHDKESVANNSIGAPATSLPTLIEMMSTQTVYSSAVPTAAAVTTTTTTIDSGESNVIVDHTYNSIKSNKNKNGGGQVVDLNLIEKTKSNQHLQNSTIREDDKTLLPEKGMMSMNNTNNNNSIEADKNREIDIVTEVPPVYETDLHEPEANFSSAGINNNSSRYPDNTDAEISVTILKGSSVATTSLPKASTTPEKAAPFDDVVTTTIRILTSRPPSTSVVSLTVANVPSLPSAVTSAPSSSTGMYTAWPTDEMATDILTTSVSSSSSSPPPASIYENHADSTNNSSDESFITTVSSVIRNATSTTAATAAAAPDDAETPFVYSPSEEVTTSTPVFISTSSSTTPPSDEDVATVPSFKPNLPPENVPGYLMLFFKSSFADLCQTSSALRENLFQYITQRSLRVQSKDQVVMVVDPEQCKEPDHSLRLIPVALYVVDDYGGYDKTLIDEMKKLLEEENLNTLPIHEIVYHENIVPDNSRVIAAMIITTIAAICFVLLIFLMCTIRNRQKLNYGQRCTPVSVDDYNLDNISEYNSIRRKGIMRASKRSYGNMAFDDPTGPSKPLTYNGLLKACESRLSLDEEFSRIPVVTVKPDELPVGAEIKNRYSNVIPLPETRVSLLSNNNCSDSVHDYINANYVKGFKDADKFYIACQAPLHNTVEDFWKMVWKEQTKVIIMLTGLSENGVEKCVDYLPPSEVLDCHRLFGDFQITLKKREVKEKYVISSLQLKNMEKNLWREIHHLWYTNWPTQGVPSEQSSIIAFLIEARAYMRNTSGPHVVHCSPGTGRTGTVLAVDICIRDYEMSRSVNIPATVAKLRRCRAGSVQTKEQYAFIYKVLSLYARKLNGGAPLDSM